MSLASGAKCRDTGRPEVVCTTNANTRRTGSQGNRIAIHVIRARHKENFSDPKADVGTPDPRTLELPSVSRCSGSTLPFESNRQEC